MTNSKTGKNFVFGVCGWSESLLMSNAN